MKQLVCALFVLSSLAGMSQRRGKPKMAPTYSEGYYINTRNDTVRGEIQNNAEDELSYYTEFNYRKPPATKSRPYNARRTKAYGFDGRHFELLEHDGKQMFVERLTSGRLIFYEYRFHGKIDGIPAIESEYFVRDTWIKDPEKALVKINNKFYKKSLKPIMKEEQPMIWDDLDKYTFNESKVVNAINEFNSYYVDAAN